MAHSIFVGYLQNGTKNATTNTAGTNFCDYNCDFYKKTEFRTHFTAKTARGVAAHGVAVGYAVKW